MKSIVFSQHAREQMEERGASQEEVVQTIRTGEQIPAKRSRLAYRKNFQYERPWGGRMYAINRSWRLWLKRWTHWS